MNRFGAADVPLRDVMQRAWQQIEMPSSSDGSYTEHSVTSQVRHLYSVYDVRETADIMRCESSPTVVKLFVERLRYCVEITIDD
jgi:hypothetical protein